MFESQIISFFNRYNILSTCDRADYVRQILLKELLISKTSDNHFLYIFRNYLV